MAKNSKYPKFNTNHEPYQYTSLPTKSSFRVLELLAGTETNAVTFRLHLADWNDPLQYEAISYAWGDTRIKVPTICDDRVLQVTPNLRRGFCKMRYRDRSRYLWADAVCINQSNDDERGDQVSNMRKIYKSATKVIVWLGQNKGVQVEKAIAAMHEISSACCAYSQISLIDLEKIDSFDCLIPNCSFAKLQCDNSSSWRALAWFFTRPWFSRLWVFQEVNSGTEAELLCGNAKVNWDVAALAVTYVFSFPHIHQAWGFHQSHCGNAYIMRQREGLDRFIISELLHFVRRFNTCDPRDRVYALLGMPPFAKMNPPWRADYQKSKMELYREVATRCILELKTLSVLSHVQHEHALQEDFPSWIPQWDQTVSRHLIGESNRVEWKAGGDTSVTAEVDDHLSRLVIAGFIFDTVETKAEIDVSKWFDSENHVMKNHPVITMQNDAKHIDYPTGEKLTEVYAIVFTGGLSYDFSKAVNKRRDFLANFAAYILRLLDVSKQDVKKYSALEHESRLGSWSEYELAARNRSCNSSFFITKKGYCGLGPNALRSGDMVCVLYGGAVPFVLRPKKELYQLIGEAYVHGIMEGEAISQWKNGGLEQMTFVIT